MKKLTQNLKLKSKIFFMLILPLLGMVYFSVSKVIQEKNKLNEVEKLQSAIQLSRSIGNFVHESQKERGYTAGFLKSDGIKFSSEIGVQRKSTDAKRRDLILFVENFESNSSELTNSLNKALLTLSKIDENRKAVSSFSILPKNGIGYYTNMHAEFFEIIKVVAKISTNTELLIQTNAYVNFLLAKEGAGTERALLTGTFATQYFDKGGYEKFIELVSEQNAHVDAFLNIASKKEKMFFNDKMTQEAVLKVVEMRNSAKLCERKSLRG